LKKSGYRQPLQITQCGGGSISVDRAIESPLLTLDFGPGVRRDRLALSRAPDGLSQHHYHRHGRNLFRCRDHLRRAARLLVRSNVAQYEYFLPKVDIQAIGSGGGSLARVDPAAKTLAVGRSPRAPIRGRCATARAAR